MLVGQLTKRKASLAHGRGGVRHKASEHLELYETNGVPARGCPAQGPYISPSPRDPGDGGNPWRGIGVTG